MLFNDIPLNPAIEKTASALGYALCAVVFALLVFTFF